MHFCVAVRVIVQLRHRDSATHCTRVMANTMALYFNVSDTIITAMLTEH